MGSTDDMVELKAGIRVGNVETMIDRAESMESREEERVATGGIKVRQDMERV